MSNFSDKFGPLYAMQKGYVVESENTSDYTHKFGGSSWNIIDEQPVEDGPALLITLDLSDPKLSGLGIKSVNEIPVCSYINSDVWLHDQVYKVNNITKKVSLLSKNSTSINIFHDEDRMPNPLPEKLIRLREIKDSEYPIDEGSYWENTDEFLGGKSFLRVAGKPLWLQEPRKVCCSCNASMTHLMSIGYEGWGGPFEYIDSMPFFIGEAALYAFFCDKCSILKVISQTS
ncbi:hypothetical protein [Aeromonas cavernicola]|uniref:DUF1963 domain-containing protein n=1 Tax=Aeromonas cavernicola TaxID=1006623 RepID=A0A2H9U0S1_9GAMM|nr:hypothetical protein [Aeromonas cavernicola]PJG57600.1 hypothetical protein CUC53_17135 [Aeromonas cavernicola]